MCSPHPGVAVTLADPPADAHVLSNKLTSLRGDYIIDVLHPNMYRHPTAKTNFCTIDGHLHDSLSYFTGILFGSIKRHILGEAGPGPFNSHPSK